MVNLHYTFLAALLSALSSSVVNAAVYTGFNYGTGLDYNKEFALARSLNGTSGAFTSARLYTMIEQGTTSTPTSAIPAAISNDVTLLLGLWASAGVANFDLEIAALKAAISTYGTAFTSRVAAISVGSEDLYRISPTGIENMSGVGAEPNEVVSYIEMVRTAIAGTSLDGALVGHVDTWTSWVNASNNAVIAASDFIGLDAYPYFQNTQSNSIASAHDLFFAAYDATLAAAGSKPVWVTETGWPVTGKTQNLAIAGTSEAEQYWDDVGCKLFGVANTYWYILDDSGATPSFGVSTGSSTPLFDLSCADLQKVSSSSSSLVASGTVSAVTSTMQSSVPVSTTLATSENGSPALKTSASADSSAFSVQSASPSAYSSALSSASSAASAASTDSTAIISPTSTRSKAMTSDTSTVLADATSTTTSTAATGTETGGVGRIVLDHTGFVMGMLGLIGAVIV